MWKKLHKEFDHDWNIKENRQDFTPTLTLFEIEMEKRVTTIA